MGSSEPVGPAGEEVAVDGRSPRRGFGPETLGLLLIVFGALFLVRNAGWFVIDWSLIWPIVVIAVGLVVVAGALRRHGGGDGETFAVQRTGEDRLEVELRVGAGRFRVGGGAEPGRLVTVESTDDDIVGRVRRDGRLARVRLARNAAWWPFGAWHGGAAWRVTLNGEVAVRLDVAGGAGDFEVDLRDVRIAEARVAVGAAQVYLALPRPTGDVPVHVSAGASSITLDVPPGVEARVTTSGLLAVDGRTETPGYATATDRVSVRVDGGAGSVRIRGTR
jgi:hypothetical protein